MAAGRVVTALRAAALVWASGMLWTSGAVQEFSQESCGDVIRSAQFRLVLPPQPARPTAANYSSCTYLVEPHTPAACRLQVEFSAFHCGPGDSALVGGQQVCGRPAGGAPSVFPLHRPGTIISFRRGPHTNGMVFDLMVQQLSCATNNNLGRSDHCGGESSNTSILLANPRATGVYPNNISCLYVIRPESPSFCELEISFLHFSLRKSHDCVKERLEIVGQDILCGVVTGSRRYHWVNNEVRIWFVTDNEYAGYGFQIHAKQILCYADNNTSTVSQNTSFVVLSRDSGNARTHEQHSKMYSSLSGLRYSQLRCGKFYSAKAFVITTPVFPNAVQRNSSCVFIIRQNNSDICRLRMALKYFCVGKEDSFSDCYGDYLEVDGHRLCGCQTGRTVMFKWEMNEVQKTLRYVSNEVHGIWVNGFIIEILQEKCFNIKKRHTTYNTSFFHEVIQPVSLSKLAEDRERLISYNKTMHEGYREVTAKKHYSSNINKPNGGVVNEKLQIFQRAMALNNRGVSGGGGRKRRSPYANNLRQCNLKTWFRMIKEVFWQNGGASMCPVPQPFACQSTNALEGSLQSPNYPGLYPPNLRCCYRISRRAGYCRVQVTLLDFSVELSTGCTKDFFVLGNSGRYCGASLAATISSLDLVERNYVDLVFVTDSSGSGRGFRAVFRQLPCSSPGPTTTTTTTTSTTWPPSSHDCGGVFLEQQFYLYSGNYNLGLALCTFTVRRVSQDVCAVQFSLERFNLTCGQEMLQIGNEFYCGPQQAGNSVSSMFDGDEVQVVYRKFTADNPGEFVIRVQQVAVCAQFPLDIPPAPRIQTDICLVELSQPSGEKAFPQPSDPADCNYLFVQQPGFCGLRLTFDRFQTRSTEGCWAEFLQLEDRKFCGSQLFNHSREIIFNGSDINVPYVVDKGLNSSDWHFSYSYIKC